MSDTDELNRGWTRETLEALSEGVGEIVEIFSDGVSRDNLPAVCEKGKNYFILIFKR